MPNRNASPGPRPVAPLNYRRCPLAVVNAFLDPADPTHAHAQRLVDHLYHDSNRQVQTIDYVVWHSLVSQLTDCVFYDSPAYLQEARNTLINGSPELHRAYLRYDFRDQLSEAGRDWHAQSHDLARWLLAFPFSDREGGIAEYARRNETIKQLAAQSPAPRTLGEEPLYHLFLRTASTVLCGINPFYSARFGYLAAEGPWTSFHWPRDDERLHPYPDAGPSVIWAERALRSIVAEDWVWMTWQITDKAYLISLH